LIKDKPTAVPIGLMSGAVVEKPIKAGEIVDSSQVSLPYTRAKELWDAFMFEKYQTPHPEHSLKNYSFHARRRKKTNGIWYRFLREGDANYQIDKIEA